MKKIVITIVAAFVLTACQSGRETGTTEQHEIEAVAETEQSAPPARRRYQPRERTPTPEPVQFLNDEELVPDILEGRLDHEGQGLSLMVDASSRDAFHRSLELIASETSEAQYVSLSAAVRMLEAYDLEASVSPDGVLSVIDGMTGEEIIERAHRMRSR